MLTAQPSSQLELRADRLDVWVANLDLPAIDMASLTQCLAADELERARRFRFRRHQRRYVVAHGFLRRLLARYLNVCPHEVRFEYGPYGKPYLPDFRRVGFNLSHSDQLAVVAVALGRDVGVDVERVRPEFASPDIAAQFFAPAEQAALNRLHASAYVQAFFACWTRKEAYIKAVGLGLSLGLDTFAVSVAPDEPSRLHDAVGGPDEVARWGLHGMDVAPGYAAAVAIDDRGIIPTIRFV